MKNLFIKIFFKLLLSSAVLASGFSDELSVVKSKEGKDVFVVSSKSLSQGYEICDCVYLMPDVDLFQKEVDFDLKNLEYTFGLFAEYKVNKMLNLYADYDFIRDENFDFMVFGLKYSF